MCCLDETGKITWASNWELLFRNGFDYVWTVEDVDDPNLFMKAFKLRRIDCCNKTDVHYGIWKKLNILDISCLY